MLANCRASGLAQNIRHNERSSLASTLQCSRLSWHVLTYTGARQENLFVNHRDGRQCVCRFSWSQAISWIEQENIYKEYRRILSLSPVEHIKRAWSKYIYLDDGRPNFAGNSRYDPTAFTAIPTRIFVVVSRNENRWRTDSRRKRKASVAGSGRGNTDGSYPGEKHFGVSRSLAGSRHCTKLGEKDSFRVSSASSLLFL